MTFTRPTRALTIFLATVALSAAGGCGSSESKAQKDVNAYKKALQDAGLSPKVVDAKRARQDAGLSPKVVDAKRARGWADVWCSVSPGISKDALEKAMGPPTDASAESESWDAFEWQFNAFFSADGSVRQMDINTIQLSETQKAALKCGDSRFAK